jgi:hypothetical protein
MFSDSGARLHPSTTRCSQSLGLDYIWQTQWATLNQDPTQDTFYSQVDPSIREKNTRLKAQGLRDTCPSVFFSGIFGIRLAKLQIDPQLESAIRPKARGYIPYGMRFSESHFPYVFLSRQHEYYWRPSREALRDAWGLLEKASRLLKDQLEYLPASGWFKHSWGLSACETRGRSRTTHQAVKTTWRHPARLQST